MASTSDLLSTEISTAEVRLQRELSAHDLLRRQDVLLNLARTAIHDPADLPPLLLEAAATVAEALGSTCGAFCGPEANTDWVLRLVRSGDRSPRAQAETTLTANPRESLADFARQQNSPITCEDLFSENRFRDVFLQQQRLRAGLMVPLLHRQETLGLLAVLDDEPRAYSQVDLRFVETVSQWLALIVAGLRTEQELVASRRFASTLSLSVNALVLEMNLQGQIQVVHFGCQEITGFAPQELNNRTLWSALLIPSEVTLVKEVFARLKSENKPVEFECHVLTKHGERRRLAWSCTAMRDANESIVSILGTGLDITEKLRGVTENAGSSPTHEQDSSQIGRRESPPNEDVSRTASGEPIRPATDMRAIMRKVFASGNQESANSEAEQPGTVYLSGGTIRDRRLRPRTVYPYKQKIAPFRAGKLPERSFYREYQCREIAAGGFSFLTETPPDCDALVIAFGVEPTLIHLSAKVLHVTRTMYQGQHLFAVGCQYLGRVSYTQA